MSKESDCEALIVCACGEGFAAERLEQKRSARMRTRRRGRWLPKQPRLGARMCQGTFFLSYRKLRFYTIKNAPRGLHCGGMVECRLRDPPQAENPASQDSFLAVTIVGIHPCGKLCRRLKGIVLQHPAGSRSTPCLFHIQVRSRTC